MNYAGFWRRFAAALIDGLVLMVPGFLMGLVGGGVTLSLVGGLVLGFLYKPIFESSVLKGTPGKALMNISVLTEAGDRLTFKQASIRFLCSYISMVIMYIGYLMQPFTAKRQTLHDMIAEAVVVKNDMANDMNYFAVWKDQFKEVVNTL